MFKSTKFSSLGVMILVWAAALVGCAKGGSNERSSLSYTNAFTWKLAPTTPEQMKDKYSIWISPNFAATDFFNFMDKDIAGWERTLRTASTFKFHLRSLPPNRAVKDPNYYKISELRGAAALFKRYRIRSSFEAGTLHPMFCSNPSRLGEQSATVDFQALRIYIEEGGTVDSIDMDGPINRAVYEDCHLSVDQAAQGVADYMKTLNQKLAALGRPAPRYNFIVNFPNWKYKGIKAEVGSVFAHVDFYDVFAKAHEITKREGVRFYSLQIDNPFFYMAGALAPRNDSMKRLRGVMEQARSHGLKVGMILNSGRTPGLAEGALCANSRGAKCRAPDRNFTSKDYGFEKVNQEDTLSALKQLMLYIPVLPDDLIVQSWSQHPLTMIPENREGSLSYTFLKVADYLAHGGLCKPSEYLQRRPDIAAVPEFSRNPTLHYDRHGIHEGMCEPRMPETGVIDPNQVRGSNTSYTCSTEDYLRLRPDVARDPYYGSHVREHYEQHGKNEGMCEPVGGR